MSIELDNHHFIESCEATPEDFENMNPEKFSSLDQTVIGSTALLGFSEVNFPVIDVRFWRQDEDDLYSVRNSSGEHMVEPVFTTNYKRPSVIESKSVDSGHAAEGIDDKAIVSSKPKVSPLTKRNQAVEGNPSTQSIDNVVHPAEREQNSQNRMSGLSEVLKAKAGELGGAISDWRSRIKARFLTLDEQPVKPEKPLTSIPPHNMVESASHSLNTTSTSDQMNNAGGKLRRWARQGLQSLSAVWETMKGTDIVPNATLDDVQSLFNADESHASTALETKEEVMDIQGYRSHALAVNDIEIVRKPEGIKSLPDSYKKESKRIREIFVDSILGKDMYATRENFEDILRGVHGKAVAAGKRYRSDMPEKYTGGDYYYGPRLYNFRARQARLASAIARQIEVDVAPKDKSTGYGYRFDGLRPNESSVYKLLLPGISEGNDAYDEIVADEEGKPDWDEYVYYYPETRAHVEYLGHAYKIGQEIQTRMHQGIISKDVSEIVDLVAKQYQYLAVARPFRHINNSIFMNLANAQLKLVGLNGISHDELDIAAQRMQQDEFVYYFGAAAQRAQGINQEDESQNLSIAA